MSVLTTGSAGCATVVDVFEVEAMPGQAWAAESPKPSAATATPAKNILFIGIPPPEIPAHLNPPVRRKFPPRLPDRPAAHVNSRHQDAAMLASPVSDNHFA